MDKVKNRFMFDTCALNRICANAEDESRIYASKSEPFCCEYYFSEIQCQESQANIAKHTDGVDPMLVERERAEWATKMLRVIPKLQTRYIGKIATLRPSGWLLDGTFEILPDSEARAFELFNAVLNDNDKQHYNDAMIAMTSIVHGCTVVTEDARLRKRVNEYFPSRAITYDGFLACIGG